MNKRETAVFSTVLIGVWLVANWFKVAVLIFLVILVSEMGSINGHLSELHSDNVFMSRQTGGLQQYIMESNGYLEDIKSNTTKSYYFHPTGY